jgi:PAS domain S-box-containing protein
MAKLIHILHLEDDPPDVELVQAVLAEDGFEYRITNSQTQDEFETSLRKDEIDIILADYKLPAYDGISALQLALEFYPDIPFIFVSGTMGEDAAIEALTRGATDYVLKDNLSRLPSAIKRALQEAEDRRERRKAREELQRSNDLLRAIIEAVPVSLIGLDLEGNVHSVWNPAAEKMLGWKAEDVMNQPLPSIPLENREEFKKLHADIRKGEIIEGVDVYRLKHNGTPIDCRIYASPLHDSQGNISGNIAALVDITEIKKAEQERLANLLFFESMDKVNKAIQKAESLQQMMKDVLDLVLLTLDCDRAYLLYPCDPQSPTWTSPMERTIPEYPGVLKLRMDISMDPQIAADLRILLAADGPVTFGPGLQHQLAGDVSKKFNIKSLMAMAIYPKTGSPWQFGIHQCSHERTWTAEETRLFEAVGRRLADALSSLLTLRDLRENEEFLNKVFEHIPNMIFVNDARTLKFVRFNKTGEDLMGYSREELIGKTVHDLFPKEKADGIMKKDRQVLHTKELHDIPEETIRNKQNEEKVLHTKKIPILDDTGTPQYLLGISEDITERKQAEEKMLRSDQRLRLHRELSPLGFLEWDENFRAVEWNAACERIFGYTREEAIGQHAMDLILPEEVHELVDGIYQSLMEQTGGMHSINKNVTKDGSIIICEWFNTTLVDKEGKPIGVASICNDITEQKQAEQSIRKLSQAIEQSPVSIVITDSEGKIEFVNSKFTQITGYSFNEIKGENPSILKSGETKDHEYRQLWETITDGGVWQGVFHNRKKNGELFWEHAIIAPVRNSENVITNYLAVKEDITERKRLEEQLHQTQKLEAIGQLAGGIAHDFNNMLGVIFGYAEMTLEKAEKDDPLRKNIETIREASIRSMEITRQLLAFARKQAVMPKILDLNKTVEGMLKLLRRLIGEDIALIWQPGDDLWQIKIDPSQVDQILANLCVNARDAIAGGGKVVIETGKAVFDEKYCAEHEGFFPGEYIMLAVSDNGSGMDKRTMEKIFEPFFTTKGLGRGTGLGLATVYGIVKQNDGFLNVTSKPGEGTTFRIYFPPYIISAEEKEEERSADRPRGGNETILLVEDETEILNMVKMMLEEFGYRVLAHSKPAEALQVITDKCIAIDLLITDMVMPVMTGQDLMERLAPLCPELKCLYMSGYSGDAMDEQGKLKKGINFIQKPFSQQELAARVRQILDS